MVTSAVQSSSIELDRLDPARRDVGDPDAGLRHQVEHVEELHLDGVRVVADVGAAGQAQRVGAPEAAAAEQHHRRAPAAATRCARRITGPHRRESGQRTAAATATAAAATEQRLPQFLVVGDPVAVQVVGIPSALSASPDSSRAQICSAAVPERGRRVGHGIGSGQVQPPGRPGRPGPARRRRRPRRSASRGRCPGCPACRSRGCRRAPGCPARPAPRRAPRPAWPAAAPGRGSRRPAG